MGVKEITFIAVCVALGGQPGLNRHSWASKLCDDTPGFGANFLMQLWDVNCGDTAMQALKSLAKLMGNGLNQEAHRQRKEIGTGPKQVSTISDLEE